MSGKEMFTQKNEKLFFLAERAFNPIKRESKETIFFTISVNAERRAIS
jgi:hypothetical protein